MFFTSFPFPITSFVSISPSSFPPFPLPLSFQGEPGAKRAMSKKDLMEREKERKKKKKARWMDKVKEIEESREKEKNKWQSFSNKAISKSKKGETSR